LKKRPISMHRREVFRCPLSVDDSFGPWAQSCRGGFDFTLLFEESILAIPLLCLFIPALFARIKKLARSQTKVVNSPLRLYKAVRTAVVDQDSESCRAIDTIPRLPRYVLRSSSWHSSYLGPQPPPTPSPILAPQSQQQYYRSSYHWVCVSYRGMNMPDLFVHLPL